MRVVVIGGGPAGLAFAARGSRLGLDVIVIDRGRSAPIVGEVITARSLLVLHELDVRQEILRSSMCLAGRRTQWGSNAVREANAISSRFGPDYAVDRTIFERILRRCAHSNGAQIIDTHAVGLKMNERTWAVEVASNREIQCDFLVDASGRAMWVTRRAGLQTSALDNLVAMGWCLPSNSERYRTVASCASGWWFRTPTPDNLSFFMFVTDRDLVNMPHVIRERSATTFEKEASCTTIRRAGTVVVKSAVYDRWAAIGDARLSHDPLNGGGISDAVLDGCELAQALALDGVSGRASRLREFSDRIHVRQLQYLEKRDITYGGESRWPTELFWLRRQAGA